MSEELIKRLLLAANGASFDGRAGDAFLMREAAHVLSRPATAVQVPEGMALVPVRATDEMLDDIEEALKDMGVDPGLAGEIDKMALWMDALAAAPAPVATEAVYQLECKMRGYTYWIDCDKAAYETEKAAGGPCRVIAGSVATEATAVQVPEYLNGGTRYKVCGQDKGSALLHLPARMAGQWVALVDATDDKHLAAAPASPAATGWMPIETAPKDNAQRILLCKDCGPGSLPSYSVGFFINGWHGAECRGMQTLDDIGYRVTHWMPLPDYPPAPSVDGEG